MTFRLAQRSLRRSPAYAVTSIGTIALTISLAATVFAIVDGVLFKPLPYRNPDELFSVAGSSREPSSPTAVLSSADLSYLRAADPRIQLTGFSGGPQLTHPDRPEVGVWTATVARNFFDVLGQRPLVGGFSDGDFGRTFGPSDVRAVVVSHTFWQQRLGGDPAVVGRTVDMMDRRFVVAGVLPRDFVFPSYDGRRRPDFLLAMSAAQERPSDRWQRFASGIARVPTGMSREEAAEKLSAALASRVAEYKVRRDIHPGPYVAVEMTPVSEMVGADERRFFRAAFAGAALIVLLGAINVAGLFGAKARDRERELSIRAALGAGRRNLVAVLLSEAAIIAIVGGFAGMLIAHYALTAMPSVLPQGMLILKPLATDWRVIAFAFAGAVVPLVVFASLPAAAAMSRAPANRLAGGTTSTPRERRWGRHTLAVAESAIGILLLLAGSLTLASFVTLRAEDAGFDLASLALVDIAIVGRPTPDERAAMHERTLARIRQVPGIAAVAFISAGLLDGAYEGSMFRIPPGGSKVLASEIGVSNTFFEVADLALRDGRYMTRNEIDARQPVAVVSEGTARAFWPGRRAVGQILESPELGTVTVVGVVEEAKFGSQAEGERHPTEVYLPEGYAQQYRAHASFRWIFLTKTSGDPDAAVSDLPLILRRDVPGVVVRRAESIDSALAKSVHLYRFRTLLFAIAGGAGLLILVVGITGAVVDGVARRVREIGIRSALGAQRSALSTMIVVEYLRPVILGCAAGLLLSWWAAQLLSTFLYRIDPHEPLVWAAAAMILMIAAAAAAWIPARRASTVDPVTVLRAD
jgi:predicted permease